MAQTSHARLTNLVIAVGVPAFNNFTLSANNNGIGWGLQARDANQITHIGFRYGARTGTPPTYVAGLESISSTTGAPDGTYLGGGSPASVTFTPPADATWDGTWQWVALTNPYTPSRGQLLAPTIRYSSGTVDGSNNGSFTSHVTALSRVATYGQAPAIWRLSSGSWTRQSGAPCTALRTGTTRYGFPIKSVYATASASTVGHRQAMKFTLASGVSNTFSVCGALFNAKLAAASGKNPIFGLWNGAGTAIQTFTLDTEWSQYPTSDYIIYEYLFDEVTLSTLSVGTPYYIGLEVADAVSGGVTLNGIQLDNTSDLDAYPGGGNFYFSSWNGSSWSDDTTIRPFMELILDDMTQASGGGGGGMPHLQLGKVGFA